MSTKIGIREKQAFVEIVAEDLGAIHRRIGEQLNEIWSQVREEIIEERGYKKLEDKKAKLRAQIDKLNTQIYDIEQILRDGAMSHDDAKEFQATFDRWGNASDCNFYGVPLRTKMDCEIARRIKSRINLEAPAKYLSDLARSAIREITMSGDYTQCRAAYETFYAIDFRKYGVDIPPRLNEMKGFMDEGAGALLSKTPEHLLLGSLNRDDKTKLIEASKELDKNKKESPEVTFADDSGVRCVSNPDDEFGIEVENTDYIEPDEEEEESK